MSWVVSVPVWGKTYARTFETVAWPALREAITRLGEPVRLVLHTDQTLKIDLPKRIEMDVRPIEHKPTYVTLQMSHADASDSAAPGDRVVFLNADLVVSGNLLTRCREHFDAGKQIVILIGIRTTTKVGDKTALTPVGAAPRDLLRWAWEHRHQIIRDLEWPDGPSMLPTNLFFQDQYGVVARGFHLHPVAIVKQPDTYFESTIDNDLLDCFPRDKMHVVTDRDDCALLEVSPHERRFPVRRDGLTPKRVAASMMKRATPMHKWLFTHRIDVVGDYKGTEDEDVAEQILLAMNDPTLARDIRRQEAIGAKGKIALGKRGT